MNFEKFELNNIPKAIKYKRSVLTINFAIEDIFTKENDYKIFMKKLESYEDYKDVELKQHKQNINALVKSLMNNAVNTLPSFKDNNDYEGTVFDDFAMLHGYDEKQLKPLYDTRKSFYNKANVFTNKSENHTILKSYDTYVAAIYNGRAYINGLYSSTTTRHIYEFLTQHGFIVGGGAKVMYKKYAFDFSKEGNVNYV